MVSALIQRLFNQYDPFPLLMAEAPSLLRRLSPDRQIEQLAAIREASRSASALSDLELTQRARTLRVQVENGSPLEAIFPDSFALVTEATQRTLKLRTYDSQIQAGLAMCQGSIAEMATGEGKTLAALFPAFVFALQGKGVHVATVNDYLAERDHGLTAPVFRLLGLVSAHLQPGTNPALKTQAYAADITYGIGSEFGFDYLRDHSTRALHSHRFLGNDFRDTLLGRNSLGSVGMQRPLAVAILDEADSILIDEAITPLLLSGSRVDLPESEAAVYQQAHRAALALQIGRDFLTDDRVPRLLPAARTALYQNPSPISWSLLQRPWDRYVENALHAIHALHRDADYLVSDGKVILIDPFTGRACPDRSLRDGVHQAVEAKESVAVTREPNSLASISRQRFYRLYRTVCGMTGTAEEAAGELFRAYKTRVTQIPLHRPSRLEILPPRIFATRGAKHAAMVADIVARHSRGQPLLIGTRTIADSENLAALLRAAGVTFRALNATQEAAEADIVSKAGERGAVTLATNMAGRGVHISLGQGVEELGGIHVLASDHQESRRIDRQLLGRAGRQGQRGSGQLYASLEDHLVQKYGSASGGSDLVDRLRFLEADSIGELPLEAARHLAKIQLLAERTLFRTRLRVMEHDRWMQQTKERVA